MLNVHFQVFSFARKKVQGFSTDRKILMFFLIIALSSTKRRLSFFLILIVNQDIQGNVHYVPEINLISKGTLIKVFYLPNKIIQKKSENAVL